MVTTHSAALLDDIFRTLAFVIHHFAALFIDGFSCLLSVMRFMNSEKTFGKRDISIIAALSEETLLLASAIFGGLFLCVLVFPLAPNHL